MSPRTSCKRGGFSLLEAVVALAIAGILAVTVLGTFRATLDASGRAEAAAQRMALAEYCLERLRLVPASALVRLPDSLRELSLPQPYAGATCRATSSPVRAARDLYELRVEVAWGGGSSALTTRMYRPPLAERRP